MTSARLVTHVLLAEQPLVLDGGALRLTAEYMGVFVFALSGALLAVRKRMDVFGVAVLALVTGVGGGVVRDLLIGDTPPVALSAWGYGAAALAAAAVGFVGHQQLERLGPAVRLFDAAGLALFTAAGTAKALDAGLPAFGAVAAGVITGIGGGMVRDVLAGEIPLVLRREIYAAAALVGAVIVAAGPRSGRAGGVVTGAAVAVTFAIRVFAIHRDWNAPGAVGRQDPR